MSRRCAEYFSFIFQHYVAGTHFYTWVERDKVEQSFLSKDMSRRCAEYFSFIFQHYVAGTHFYTWVERDKVEQSFLSKETTRRQKPGSNLRPSGWKSDALTTRPPRLYSVHTLFINA